MAVAASIRSLIHALPAIHTTNNSSSRNHCSLHSFSTTTNLFESKTLNLKTVTLKPLSSLLNSRLSSSSSFAAYAETDEEDYEEGEGEQEEEEEEEEEERLDWRSRRRQRKRGDFVGNLLYTITSDQVAEIFSQADTVETLSGDAKVAIRMFDGSKVGGRTVKVNFPEVPRGGEREMMGRRTRASSRGYVDSPYKVYAGNLGWSVTAVFEGCLL